MNLRIHKIRYNDVNVFQSMFIKNVFFYILIGDSNPEGNPSSTRK